MSPTWSRGAWPLVAVAVASALTGDMRALEPATCPLELEGIWEPQPATVYAWGRSS